LLCPQEQHLIQFDTPPYLRIGVLRLVPAKAQQVLASGDCQKAGGNPPDVARFRSHSPQKVLTRPRAIRYMAKAGACLTVEAGKRKAVATGCRRKAHAQQGFVSQQATLCEGWVFTVWATARQPAPQYAQRPGVRASGERRERRLFLTILLFVLGFALIIKGGDYFVDASVAIAEHLRIPRVVIGTTLVSIATTSPEFIVSTTASLTGRPGIAIGNAVGSAILNIGLILGIICMIRAIPVSRHEFRIPSFALLGAASLLTILTFRLTLSRASGLLLIGLGLSYLFYDYFRHKRSAQPEGAEESQGSFAEARMRTFRRAVVFFLIGLAMVVVGSKLTIDAGVKIAISLGVSEIFIGLTLIALGTSLPELVTAVASVRKGVAALSLGNIVGAGLLNCTVVTGTAAAITPLVIKKTTQVYNLPALLVIVVTLMILARTGGRLSRRDGGILLCLYVAYIVGLVLLQGY
jgi:cation:H+ antiporter